MCLSCTFISKIKRGVFFCKMNLSLSCLVTLKKKGGGNRRELSFPGQEGGGEEDWGGILYQNFVSFFFFFSTAMSPDSDEGKLCLSGCETCSLPFAKI